MKRKLLAVVAVMVLAAAAGRMAAGQVRAGLGTTEPEAVQLLRIDMRKALLEADAAPRVTQARLGKLRYLQGLKESASAKDLADADVDVIEAQTSEQVASVNAKSVEAQLKGAINNAASIPARQPASPGEVSALQLEEQKAELQAAGSAKVAENRGRLLGLLLVAKANAGQIADAQADVEATKANAGLAALEVEAAKVRLDSAVKSMSAPK